jgi:hypothetical protein
MPKGDSTKDWEPPEQDPTVTSGGDLEFIVGYPMANAPDGDQVYGFGGLGKAAKSISRPLAEVKAEWAGMMEKVAPLIETASRANPAGEFQLDVVELALGFNASGHLAFIAEAGVEATVTLTFNRKS